jgi:hypothetical protein
MALAYFVWFHDFIHHAHAPGISRGFWRSPGIIVIIAAILIPWQLLMIAGAGEANSAVRLWFRCCIVAGMKYDDIAVLTGRSKVAEISNLLLTPYRSRSYIGEPRSMQS